MVTANKLLNQPANGSSNWDVPLNADFGIIDAALGTANTIAVNTVTGATPQPIALSTAQIQGMAIIFSGVQSVNINYQVPSAVGGQWVIINNATGAFTIRISSAAGGPTMIVDQGTARSVYSDGTANGIIGADSANDVTSSNQQIIYNSSGALVGDDGLTFNGSKLVVSPTSAATAAVTHVARFQSQSSGTPAAGIGVAVEFAAETAVSSNTVGGLLSVAATDVTPGSEDFTMTLRLMAAGALADVVVVTSTAVMTIGGNQVITADQATATQSLGAAGIVATADNDGTKSSGTYTPTPIGGNFKRIVNGGAFTLAAPSATGDYTLLIQVTNNASAGVVTFSGFSKTTGIFTTTNGDDFFLSIIKCNGFVSGDIKALQ